LEVDISDKVNRFLKYGLPGLMLIAVLSASGVWYYQHSHAYMTIRDAQVTSTLVGAKVRVPGVVTEVLVKDGEQVSAGQVLAHVKVNVTEDQIRQLQQTVDLSKQNLAALRAGTTTTQPVYSSSGGGGSSADVGQAAANLEKMEQLYALGAVSAAKRDEAAAAYAAAQAASGPSDTVSYQTVVQPASPQAIRSAELQVKQAEAALESAKKESMATDVTAPVAGTAYLTDVAANSEVRAGQTIVNIGDAGNIWLEAYINADRKDKVRLGQFVAYTIDGKEYQGSILDIQDPVDMASANDNTEGDTEDRLHGNKVTLKISLPAQTDASFHPGQAAVVKISL